MLASRWLLQTHLELLSWLSKVLLSCESLSRPLLYADALWLKLCARSFLLFDNHLLQVNLVNALSALGNDLNYWRFGAFMLAFRLLAINSNSSRSIVAAVFFLDDIADIILVVCDSCWYSSLRVWLGNLPLLIFNNLKLMHAWSSVFIYELGICRSAEQSRARPDLAIFVWNLVITIAKLVMVSIIVRHLLRKF